MFKIDHIMFESVDPEKSLKELNDILGLPEAWPYHEGPDYDSVGLNLGSINLEFIRFRKRFGKAANSDRNCLSGIAFEADGELSEIFKFLNQKNIVYSIGEDISAHITIPIGDPERLITPFLVKYKFNTSGWRKRLKEEFAASGGGKQKIDRNATVILGNSFQDLAGIVEGVHFDASITDLQIRLTTTDEFGLRKEIDFLGVTFDFA